MLRFPRVTRDATIISGSVAPRRRQPWRARGRQYPEGRQYAEVRKQTSRESRHPENANKHAAGTPRPVPRPSDEPTTRRQLLTCAASPQVPYSKHRRWSARAHQHGPRSTLHSPLAAAWTERLDSAEVQQQHKQQQLDEGRYAYTRQAELGLHPPRDSKPVPCQSQKPSVYCLGRGCASGLIR